MLKELSINIFFKLLSLVQSKKEKLLPNFLISKLIILFSLLSRALIIDFPNKPEPPTT